MKNDIQRVLKFYAVKKKIYFYDMHYILYVLKRTKNIIAIA